jgi:hypothetical protein
MELKKHTRPMHIVGEELDVRARLYAEAHGATYAEAKAAIIAADRALKEEYAAARVDEPPAGDDTQLRLWHAAGDVIARYQGVHNLTLQEAVRRLRAEGHGAVVECYESAPPARAGE